MEMQEIELLRQATSGPMTEEEASFCRDIQQFIDYAVRNGLGLIMVLGVLSHDISGIQRAGSLADAIKDGFRPKVHGWAAAGREVGEPEEAK